ncbi:MAG: hypothetical protein Q8R11_01620 [bacterium]|nr:hypothetical protein [bacterium]
MLELLLVSSILGILAALSIPVGRTLLLQNDLRLAAVSAIQSMRRAQVLSQASDSDNSWGVSVQPGAITLFQGSSFASRNTPLDEATILPSTIAVTGLTEVVFDRFTGTPQQTGTLTLSNETTTSVLTLNAKGMVSD